ncbi:hypothetical protein C1645_842787 [Glomus cerebriforme]|uniref:HCP-like protein n=1 Tax=Glomus cerebriforme TaxID=658196 RepID=A0A397RWC0_9GLOM|nr:hypothetical protein C1645_842787 [Glomus cerebriforme]
MDQTDAMNNLAIFYENGFGTEENLEKAFYWYQKAAENGNSDAMCNLAIFYENGFGTEENLEKAFYWCQKAAEIGDQNSMNNLANCYKIGFGTEKDLEKAFYWYQKAIESSKITSKNSNNDKLCKECKQSYIDYNWCQQCNTKRFQQDFSKWTRGFSEIYKAIWLDGPIDGWDFDKQEWNRWNSQLGYEIILKNLNNSSSLNNKFLSEVKLLIISFVNFIPFL